MSISANNVTREDEYTKFDLIIGGDIGQNYFTIKIKYKTKDTLNDTQNLSDFNYEASICDIYYHHVSKGDIKPSTKFENIVENNLDYLISMAIIDRIEM